MSRQQGNCLQNKCFQSRLYRSQVSALGHKGEGDWRHAKMNDSEWPWECNGHVESHCIPMAIWKAPVHVNGHCNSFSDSIPPAPRRLYSKPKEARSVEDLELQGQVRVGGGGCVSSPSPSPAQVWEEEHRVALKPQGQCSLNRGERQPFSSHPRGWSGGRRGRGAGRRLPRWRRWLVFA